MWGKNKKKTETDLTEGSIVRGLAAFVWPLFLGQLLQQLYNMADAWVVGNFADNDAFAAVSLSANMTFLIIGFFNGIALGGGVVISRYYGQKNKWKTRRAIHTNFMFGIAASVLSTIVGLLLVPQILHWLKTPESVMPDALVYFRIYFAGVSTVIMYNICMAIMRSLGDSLHPLYYLIISSVTNVVLDLLFVAVFDWGVAGAAVATVIAQGLSAVLCIIRMCRAEDEMRLELRRFHFHPNVLRQILAQGLPSGIQSSVISVGNLVVQANINSFGAYAISGHGAYAKIEGLVFLPIMSISLALPTFVSQNLGAQKYDRVKKGGRRRHSLGHGPGGADGHSAVFRGALCAAAVCGQRRGHLLWKSPRPDRGPVFLPAGIFPLRGGRTQRVWEIRDSHGDHAGLLVRYKDRLCDDGAQSVARVSDHFLGISSDLVSELGGAACMYASDAAKPGGGVRM